jgi:predicted outer membrane lipoprotein
MDGFIALAYEHRDGIASAMSNMASQMREALEKARRDPAYVRKARDAPLNDSRPRTLLILGELLRGSNLDPKVAISENDVIDLIHATMPLNCCDFVLLDARWVERIDKMKRRLAKSSMIMPVAQCYSRRNNGIEAFLNNLEAFDPQAQPPPPIR